MRRPAASSSRNVATTGAWSLVPNSRIETQAVRPRREVAAGEHVVEPPADVALAHVPPGRPPGEERVVVGVQLAPDVVQPALVEHALEQRPLVRALADRALVALLAGGRRAALRAMLRSPHSTTRSPVARSAAA